MMETAFNRPTSVSSLVSPMHTNPEIKLNVVLAQTVKKLRTRKNLSQEELAGLAHVDRTYISGIERARRNITMATLERLIPHLSADSVDFFRALALEIETYKTRSL